MNEMLKPIAVFDAGIGSYAIVDEIKKRLPKQDIIYFADRASFPYGAKGHDELLTIIRRTIQFLESFEPSTIIVASNAPSIMVLEQIKSFAATPIFGVYPPLTQAIAMSKTGFVGVMGVQSLVESEMALKFVKSIAPAPERVALINASPMVELVENGSFLFSENETQIAVDGFVKELFEEHPSIDVLTLSSTHLPWLRIFFERARPNCVFLDPAEDIVRSIGAGSEGTGRIRTLVTEDENYDLHTFQKMLEKIGVKLELEAVTL